ncbi:MAG: chromate transporter [Lachnospiraceae bacterium]|nr:chromate transporter [Lachnospiraceae bacterium]
MSDEEKRIPGSSDAGLSDLFITFAKIGVMTFGGGAAMLPMLQREVIDNKNWVAEEELIDYYAIGQCTPGIIAVNTATFVGYRKRGIAGGIIATLGVIFPSLVIITLLAGLIQNFADLPVVKSAFAGIRVCVCVLILNAVLKLLKKSVIDKVTVIIFILVLAGSCFLDLSPIIFVVVSAAAGLILKALSEKKGGEQ